MVAVPYAFNQFAQLLRPVPFDAVRQPVGNEGVILAVRASVRFTGIGQYMQEKRQIIFDIKEGKLIFMTTHVYLIEALGNTDAIRPENSEGIVDVKWFPRNEALELIEYKDTEKLFRIGLSKIKEPA